MFIVNIMLYPQINIIRQMKGMGLATSWGCFCSGSALQQIGDFRMLGNAIRWRTESITCGGYFGPDF
jgi:hypothetical protein